MDTEDLMSLSYERVGPVGRAFKKAFTDPMVNWLVPAPVLRWLLRVTRSEMAHASWADPGGWKSMILSYREDTPPQVADRFLIKLGSMPIALRNRKRMCTEIIARMIRQRAGQQTNVVCLGAGPGMIAMEAIHQSGHDDCHAYMIDLNPDSFEFGRKLAEQKKLHERIRFIHGDVSEYEQLCNAQPHIVKMIGICEYLPDEVVHKIASAIVRAMPADGRLLANSLTRRHGTERFFRRVFDLHMIHRTAGQMRSLLEQAGLAVDHVLTEPMGVYDVLICRKK